MPTNNPDVVVLISCYNGQSDLPVCLQSVLESETDLAFEVVVVDNASTDGSGDYIREHFPQVDCIRTEPNRGFTGGNNFGYEHIKATYPEARYLALLNVDTEVESGWLSALVQTMQAHDDAGAVQSKLLLHNDVLEEGSDKPVINTVGNRSHFLGFGFMIGYGEVDEGQYDRLDDFGFASGGAVLLRMDLLEDLGLFDTEFFMYLDDTDLCWKLRQIGYRSILAPSSIVYHKYQPDAPSKHYYHLERNRWVLLLTYYRLGTLILLYPALAMMEIGQFIFSLTRGTLGQKWQSMFYFWRPSKIAWVWARRRQAQRRRTCGDRQFMSGFVGVIDSPVVQHPLLRWIGNPALSVYWAIARRVIFW